MEHWGQNIRTSRRVRRWRRALLPAATAVLMLATPAAADMPPFAQGQNTVTLPAGSVNGLADAIAQAGPGGIVLVASGSHVEEGTVVIDIPVSILGEAGAVIESATRPAATLPFVVEPALHVLGADKVSITGLELRPLGDGPGNTAILVEDADKVTVESNSIYGYQDFGVVVQNGNHVDVSSNEIVMTEPLTDLDTGVIIVNGRFARVTDNFVSQAATAIFVSDRDGHANRNVATDSLIGLILCNVPPILEISGEVAGSATPATRWHVQKNTMTNSFWGYAVTDGANRNVLVNNEASDNFIDIEVLGDSMFFGFFTPTAFDNLIAVGPSPGISVHDCGEDTRINGDATLVDLDDVPCF